MIVRTFYFGHGFDSRHFHQNKIKNKIVDKIKNCLEGQFFVTSYKDSLSDDHQ